MFAGTAVYSFEGIAMVLPIQNSMKRPQDLVQLLSLSMFGMSVLLASFGAFCFYVFGQNTANIVISNLPRGQPLTQATQIAYLFVAVVTVPMCLFPAIRIWERWVFTKQRHSGKKWQKNFLRTAAAVGCLFIGVYGGTQLDHLVSVIGGMFSTPLALVFPPLLHLTSRADPRPCAQAMDVVLIAFGVVAGVMATWVAVSSW
jgi:proton-coupled amino acid transporter